MEPPPQGDANPVLRAVQSTDLPDLRTLMDPETCPAICTTHHVGGRVLVEQKTRLATPDVLRWRQSTGVTLSCLRVTLFPFSPVASYFEPAPTSSEQCHEYSLLDELQVF